MPSGFTADNKRTYPKIEIGIKWIWNGQNNLEKEQNKGTHSS